MRASAAQGGRRRSGRAARRAQTAGHAALAVVLLLLCVGCTGSGAAAGSSSPKGVSGSAATPAPAGVKDGHLTFTVLFLRCGLTAVAGTHSEGTPQGQYCQARLRVANNDPQEHTYVARRQLIAGVGAADSRPSAFAMAVRRQLDEVPIGAHDLVEVEVWYDVPKHARVTGLRLGGDRDATGFLDPTTVPYVRGGAFVAVTPTSDAPPPATPTTS